MREISSRVAYLESDEIESIHKRLLLDDMRHVDGISKITTTLLRWLLGVHNGALYVFSFKEKILSQRVILEKLKQKGFIQSYGEGVVYCDYPRFNFFGIFLFIENKTLVIKSWGYTLPFEDKNVTIIKALGEALERQAAYYLKNSTSINYPKFKKGDASFLYDLIPKFSSSQILKNSSYVRNKEDMKIMTGFCAPSLTGGGIKFLPVDCFYWGYKSDTKEKFFQELNTSGSGGGYTKEDATLSALYEHTERDLFMLFWYSKVTPKIIDIDNEEGEFFDYVKDAKERFSLEIYFLDIRYDIDIPACLCVIVDPVLHLIAVGAKVSYDAESVVKGAYLEALASLSSVRSRKERIATEEMIQEIINKQQRSGAEVDKALRVILYCSPLGIDLIKNLWITNNERSISFQEFNRCSKKFPHKKAELAFVCSHFKRLVKEKGEGYHVYRHEFSSLWTTLCGYRVVHVFVPTFLKLHLRESFATPISERLIAFAKTHHVVIRSEDDINYLPHLFP